MKELFLILDYNKDGLVDFSDWKYHFPDEVVGKQNFLLI